MASKALSMVILASCLTLSSPSNPTYHAPTMQSLSCTTPFLPLAHGSAQIGSSLWDSSFYHPVAGSSSMLRSQFQSLKGFSGCPTPERYLPFPPTPPSYHALCNICLNSGMSACAFVASQLGDRIKERGLP